MINKRLTTLLVLFLAIIFIPSIINAECINGFNDPEDTLYTYTINIPFEVSVNALDCDMNTAVYQLELTSETLSQLYYNVSFDLEYEHFDVDYSGNYSLSVWIQNTTGDWEARTTEFRVNRDEFESTRPIAAFFGSFLLLFIAVIVFSIGNNFSEEHTPLKIFFIALPMFMIVSSIQLAILSLREYVKVPALTDTLQAFNTIFFWGVIFIFFVWIMIYLTIKALELFKLKKEGGDNDY